MMGYPSWCILLTSVGTSAGSGSGCGGDGRMAGCGWPAGGAAGLPAGQRGTAAAGGPLMGRATALVEGGGACETQVTHQALQNQGT